VYIVRITFPEEEKKAELEAAAIASPGNKPAQTNSYAPVNRQDES
jgi:hypothetical protein